LLFAIAVVVYIIASLIYGFWDYTYRKNEIIRDIDSKLYNSAAALKYILPDDFHDRAIDEQAISIKEDKSIAHKLTKLIKETGFKYTYTIVKKGDKLFFVAGDIAADPETKRGTFYFYPYEEADESFFRAFEQDKPIYKTVSDQWGTVRSVIVPEKSPGGIKYLACADYDISYVKELLQKNLLRSIVTVLSFVLLSIPIIIIYTRSYYEYQDDLAESREKDRELANSLPQVVFEMNYSGRITLVNRNAYDFLGYTQNYFERKTGKYIDANEAAVRLTGRTLSELKQLTTWGVTQNGARERFKIISESNAAEDLGMVTYDRPDGSQRVAILTSVPLDSEAVIGIARDITDELAMEDHLRQAQKMEAIGTLAGGIAHDFNNILFAILGYSELALAEMPSEASIRIKLEAIHSSGERARDLVAQILAFSRKDEQVRTPVEMHLILEDALKLLRPAIPTTIDIQTQLTSKCHILGDPSRLHQIIMNLCTNAYQAMLETGGTLKISLSAIKMEGEAAKLAQIPTGFYGKLIISDTGVGIPPADLTRIFDPYFTTKEKGKGTGLGLAAVHGIVKSHGGAILVKSQLGKGTKFEVYLPLTPDRSDTEERVASQIDGGNERILLVDDEHDVLDVEKEMLKKLGYIITAKDNAREALKLFAGQPDQFDLVITDMTMPDMTGDKLAGELSKIRSDIPIILCTGFSELIFKEKAESLGIMGFLMKPVTMRDLSNMIRKVLDKLKS
jgi:PAS domain S-box-containing protein